MRPLELTPVPDPPGKERGGAEISACGRYRYTLWRRWDDGPQLVACMLNPSTADAYKPDHTVRKLIGFAKRNELSAILIVNLFAFRTAYPKELARAAAERTDIEGPENVRAVWEAMRAAKESGGTFLVGWGSQKLRSIATSMDLQARAIQLAALAMEIDLKCLGTAKDGNPRHPLMLSYDTPLQTWRHPTMEKPCSKP